MLQRVAALPGVARAAFVWGLPLTGNKWPGAMELVGQPGSETPAGQLSFPFRSVTPDYFGVMGIELMAGRLFTAFDNADAPLVVIINQTLAARYYKGVNPIGQQMRSPGDPKRTFEVVATGLALVGIYGVLSLSVGSRIKEIAVRKAIGAQQHDILRSILGEGSRLIVVGVALGAFVAVLVGQALEGLLFEVQAADPFSLGAAAVIFGIVALGACMVPAVRAARTDLLSALHHD